MDLKNNKALIAIVTIALIGGIILTTQKIDSFEGNNLHADPPKTVDYVDPAKYVGTWYEQAVIPYYFERDCTNTEAIYSIISTKTLRVDNICYR